MKEIGGYFELELQMGRHQFHDTRYRLKSGRSSLNFILQQIKPPNVYVPFYTCDALLEPLLVNNIPFTFYAINTNFEIADLPILKQGELLIYVNYFDLKRKYVEIISKKFKDQLIVDCTQSYFLKGNNKSWYFNSTRKFFGVPDGSDLYVPYSYNLDEQYEQLSINENYTTAHLLLRFNGHTLQGHQFFKENEQLNNSDMCKVSRLSGYLTSHISFEQSVAVRQQNFKYLHQTLQPTNQLPIDIEELPMSNFYPYLPDKEIDKKFFWDKKVFVPVLWPDCVNRTSDVDFAFEKSLSFKLLPLPVDHRYDVHDMKTIINLIFNNNELTC